MKNLFSQRNGDTHVGISILRVVSLFCHCSPADLDELVIHSLQYRPVLHSRSMLQRFLSDLLLPLQPVLDHADAAAGPRLLPAVRRHACHCAPAQVHTAAFLKKDRKLNVLSAPRDFSVVFWL